MKEYNRKERKTERKEQKGEEKKSEEIKYKKGE